MKPTNLATAVQKRPHASLFIVGLTLVTLVPILLATFLVLFPGSDALWFGGVGSIIVGAALLLWYALLAQRGRDRDGSVP